MSFKAGLGLDFPINTNFYVRVAGLFGYKFISQTENDVISESDDFGVDASFTTFGYEINPGLGYKF